MSINSVVLLSYYVKENNDKNDLNKNKQIIMIILFAKIANKNDLNDTCYVFH